MLELCVQGCRAAAAAGSLGHGAFPVADAQRSYMPSATRVLSSTQRLLRGVAANKTIGCRGMMLSLAKFRVQNGAVACW